MNKYCTNNNFAYIASRAGLEEMRLLLTLLLGAAVQCPNKQFFIAGIKELDLDTQHAIVELIKQVTDNQSLVLTNDSLDHLSPQQMYEHIIRIARERDKFQSNWISSLAAKEVAETKLNAAEAAHGGSGLSASAGAAASATATDNNHLAVELADLKAKLRRFRQELEEKSESYIEVKEDLEHTQMQYEKLRAEVCCVTSAIDANKNIKFIIEPRMVHGISSCRCLSR